MNIRSVRVFRGPSHLATEPVIVVALALAGLEAYRSAELGHSFAANLMALLPGLSSQPMGTDTADTVSEAIQSDAGLPLALVVAVAAAELQRMVRLPNPIWGALVKGAEQQQVAFFGYRDDEAGFAAGRTAVDIVRTLAQSSLRDGAEEISTADARQMLDRFVDWAHTRLLDQSTLSLVGAAEKRNIPWVRISPYKRFVQLGHGRNLIRIHETLTDTTSTISGMMTSDKVVTATHLQAAGLPVTAPETVYDEDMAVRVAEQIGYPVVVKPNFYNKGIGISLRLRTEGDVRTAYTAARRYHADVMVEKHIDGDDHRILVVGGRVIGVARRTPGKVTGDGVHTVSQLLDVLNRDPRRGVNFEKQLNRMEMDDLALSMLAEKGYGPATVPANGEDVFLRRTANIATGGTAEDVTEQAHPDNLRLAVRAARVVGADISGVDFLTTDISRSYREIGGAICEVNGSPGLRVHQVANPDRDVAGPVIDHLFPNGATGRIPIAVICGGGATTQATDWLTRMIGHVVRDVACVSRNGVTVGNEPVADGDRANWDGAQMVFRDPKTACAVLELPNEELVRDGAGFDRCTVAAFTGLSDSAMRFARRVCAITTGMVVLDADDPLAFRLASETGGQAICLASGQQDSAAVSQHVSRGGRAVCLTSENGRTSLLVYDKGETRSHEMASTVSPKDSEERKALVVAAAMAVGLELPPEAITAFPDRRQA